MKTLLTFSFLFILLSVNAQLVIKNDTLFRTADQMLLANELFESGEPFAEALGYNLDDLDPMLPNSPDSVSYATGIEGYEYSRYLLGNVVSRSGIGLHMMWSPRIGQMAAMEPDTFDGKFTGGMVNGYKEDDELMMMIHHLGMLANQMPFQNPFPQFAEFESGNPQLSQTVAPDFAMNFSTLRWNRRQFSKVLNPAAMGQSLWKQYFWAQDMLGAFHDSLDATIDADGVISPDSAGSPKFDPNNNVFYGGNNLDGFIGQVLTAEGINKIIFLLNNLAYNGTDLGMVDAATYNPENGIQYFPHKIAVTEEIVDTMLPPKLSSLTVTDANSHIFDQVSLLLGTLAFKNMMDPSVNDPAHLAYHEVFDGDPFPAAMSQSGMMGPYDIMAGSSMVLVHNLLAMHFDNAAGTFVDVSGLNGAEVDRGNEISAVNAGYVLLALAKAANEFAGMPLAQMATDALNAQANFVLTQLKDDNGGYYNSYIIDSGAAITTKKAESQAAIARGLYAAYQLTNNADYLAGADAAYLFLTDNFYVPQEKIFRTEQGDNTAMYNPKNLAILAGGLREAALVGNHPEAASIYTRFFTKVYNPMLLAEAEASGETGNDSDGDNIPYVADGNVATVFAAESEYNFTVASINDRLQQQADLSIYPNPVQSQATISFNRKDFTNTSISVVNIVGQKVQNIKTNNYRKITWNVHDLNEGIYFVWLESNGKPVAVKKIIISK
ncbi:MAG TPA: T9SS type A sorting domain-containing protein [Bacteroidales bacterium]|nr:T9SS type A sorting domain-containing protein [Bacteroidales bacterium]